MAQDNNFTKKSFTFVLIAAFVVLFILLFFETVQVMMLIFMAILFSVFLRGLSTFLRKYIDVNRTYALFIVLGVLIALSVGLGFFIGPSISQSIADVEEKGPAAVEELEKEIRKFSWGDALIENVNEFVEEFSGGSEIRKRITGIFSSIFSVIVALFAIFIIGLYMAFHPGEYSEGFLILIPKEKRKRGGEILDKLQNALVWWMVGRFTSMAVVGILTTIGLLILDIPLAITLGVLAALLTFIPNLGPFLAAIPAVAMGYITSPAKAFYVILLYIGIQTIETYLITPQVQKQAVSLAPALLLSFEIIIGVLLGIPGLIVATPLLVVIIVLVQTLYVQDVLGEKIKVMGE